MRWKEVSPVLTVVPNYYAAFRCIGGACRHTCCVGWEIDLDEATLARYRTAPDGWAERLCRQLSGDKAPHFTLTAEERCPFLNGEGLCDIQLSLGEAWLCDICREHPRFHNALPGRTESGLGLCCEAAARLILGQTEPMTLCVCGTPEGEDELIALRDTCLRLLQNRAQPIHARVAALLEAVDGRMPAATPAEWAQVLLSLERLDEGWTSLLIRLQTEWATADTAGFDAYMAGRQTEYEQLLAYVLYRHMALADSREEAAARVGLAVLAYTVLRALGAVLWTADGRFTFEQQCDLARQFSAEIEYSDENLIILLETLGGM